MSYNNKVSHTNILLYKHVPLAGFCFVFVNHVLVTCQHESGDVYTLSLVLILSLLITLDRDPLHFEMPGCMYVCVRESVFVCSSVHACVYVCVCMVLYFVCIYRIS